MQTPLGEFETLLILAILQLAERDEIAYGPAIRSEIEARAGRSVSRGAVYITLDRLEEKGLLSSRDGDTGPGRGQSPRRLFTVTAAGRREVKTAVTAVVRMHEGLQRVLGKL